MSDFLLLVTGMGVLVVGAAWLVAGAVRLAGALGMPPLITGLTIVAFGTSAPELVVSVLAGLREQPGVAMGNALGSNIFNVLFILGLSALIVPLSVARRLIRIDIPLLIVFSALAWGFAANGLLGRGEGVVLLALLVGYTLLLAFLGRGVEPAQVPRAPGEDRTAHARLRACPVLFSVLGVLAGLAALALGAHWTVESAVALARRFSVPEGVIGVTLLAAGTSLPEAATSIVAAVRGQRDIAVGNLIGSNVFNLLGVLGAAAVLAPEGLFVSRAFCVFDVPIMFSVAVVCLPVFISGARISRTEGGILLAYYALYLGLKILRTGDSAHASAIEAAAVYALLPATALFLAVSLARSQHELNAFARDVAQNLSDAAAYSVRNARKLVVLVTSGTVLLVGLALLFLPGPGTVVLFIGLAMLATEFVWARRLIKRMRDQVEGAADYLRRKDLPPDEDGHTGE